MAKKTPPWHLSAGPAAPARILNPAIPASPLFICFFLFFFSIQASARPEKEGQRTARDEEGKQIPSQLLCLSRPAGLRARPPAYKGVKEKGERALVQQAAGGRAPCHKTRAGQFLGASYKPHLPAGGFPRQGQTLICPNLTNRGNNCG